MGAQVVDAPGYAAGEQAAQEHGHDESGQRYAQDRMEQFVDGLLDVGAGKAQAHGADTALSDADGHGEVVDEDLPVIEKPDAQLLVRGQDVGLEQVHGETVGKGVCQHVARFILHKGIDHVAAHVAHRVHQILELEKVG